MYAQNIKEEEEKSRLIMPQSVVPSITVILLNTSFCCVFKTLHYALYNSRLEIK